MTVLVAVGCGVLGLAVGPFLTVVVERVPLRQPVLSGTPWAGARRPVLPLAAAALFASAAVRFGADAALPAYLVFFAALLAISVVDLEHLIVPNRIVYPALFATVPLLALAAAVNGEWGHLGQAALGGLLAWTAFFGIHLLHPEGMGFGDVRLAGLIGIHLGWLGLGHVLLGLFLAFLAAALVGVVLILANLRTRKDSVPFGPFLAVGAVVAVLVGGPIIAWYRV